MSDRSAELRDLLAQYMSENNLKRTRQRDVILETFLNCGDHTTIDSLLAAVQEVYPAVGYATVYRTLRLFVAAGVASERRFGDGPAMYEAAELDDHHDHLICISCNRIFEFEDAIIEERQEMVAKQFGVRLTSHRMTLYGECIDVETCKANTVKR
jgi:Fur family ferric uptake transcriptional regulator